MGKKKKEKKIILNEAFAKSLCNLHEKVEQQLAFVEKAKKTNSELPIDGHIASWEAFRNRLNLALDNQPEIKNIIEKAKMPKLKVGEYFYTKQSKIVYKATEILETNEVLGINKLKYMGATNNIKVHLLNVIKSDKAAYKEQHKEESTEFGGKIKKSKKKDKKKKKNKRKKK